MVADKVSKEVKGRTGVDLAEKAAAATAALGAVGDQAVKTPAGASDFEGDDGEKKKEDLEAGGGGGTLEEPAKKENWVEQWDPNNGRYYHYNMDTGRSIENLFIMHHKNDQLFFHTEINLIE